MNNILAFLGLNYHFFNVCSLIFEVENTPQFAGRLVIFSLNYLETF